MKRIAFRIEAVKEKNCYTCKYIKFNNGYGSCVKSGFLVNESNYCTDWRKQK